VSKMRWGIFRWAIRFLADEWLPDGLQVKESVVLARALAENGVAYISTMAGTYESFFLPEVVQRSQKARRGQERTIVHCGPKCNACMELVMQGKPAFCPRWSREKRTAYRELFR
jgi:hypothetical protein